MIQLLGIALTLREWFGPPPARGWPGRPVRFVVGLVEVERLYGTPGFTTGARLRRSTWVIAGDRADRVRLVVPWPWGCLWLMEAGRP